MINQRYYKTLLGNVGVNKGELSPNILLKIVLRMSETLMDFAKYLAHKRKWQKATVETFTLELYMESDSKLIMTSRTFQICKAGEKDSHTYVRSTFDVWVAMKMCYTFPLSRANQKSENGT